ncbi:PAS domain-containing hybrid sensor histidine kinase/response regulator [Sedimentisphaera salicampi]|uniref:histidine kinase n=1 Tax=Sedimentisphaera salicampi TaxID=1941349 RepID=A0A1W6LNQ1_9BACT|nr:PAS domain-containing hybrid sensor histidine kinase/response regulator [Sedimentisphaera salicampi]ARN57363.1 Virulence sensor protein BvgS precursor [Sedimentisphaera salicampi]
MRLPRINLKTKSLRKAHIIYLTGMFVLFITPLICQQYSLRLSKKIEQQAEREEALLSLAYQMQLKMRIASQYFETYCISGEESYAVEFAKIVNQMGGTKAEPFQEGFDEKRHLYSNVSPERFGLNSSQASSLNSIIEQINNLINFEIEFSKKIREKYTGREPNSVDPKLASRYSILSGREDVMAPDVYENYFQKRLRIRDNLDGVISEMGDSSNKLREQNIQHLSVMSFVSQAATGLSIIGLIGLSVFMNRKIISRILKGSESMEKNINEENLSARLDLGESEDEIGRLAKSFNTLTARLSNNYEFLRTILSSVNEAIIVCSPDKEILRMNESAVRMTGMKVQPEGGSKADDILKLHQNRKKVSVEELIDNVIARGESKSLKKDLNMKSAQGAEYIIELIAKPLQNERGGTTNVIISIFDFTFQHRQFEKLVEAQKKFELLLKGSMLGMWEYDYKENAFYTQPGFFKMLGLETLGEGPHSPNIIKDICHPDDYENLMDSILNFSENPKNGINARFLSGCGKWRKIYIYCEFLDYHNTGSKDRLAGFNQDITEQVDSERKIAESHTLHDVAEIASLGYYNYNFEKKTYEISDGIRKIMGMPEGQTEISLDQLLDSIEGGEDQIPLVAKNFDKYGPGIEPRKFLMTLNYRGVRKTLRVQPQVERNKKGEPVGLWGVVQDVTDFEKARKEAVEKSALFRDITENSMFGVFITKDNEFVYANERFAELIGESPDSLIGKNYSEIFAEKTCSELSEINTSKDGSENNPLNFGIKISTKEGRSFIANIYQRSIEYNSRECLLVMLWDDTEKAETEQKLRLNQFAMDSSNDEIYVCDERGNIIYCNEAVAHNTGYDKHSLMGENISMVFNTTEQYQSRLLVEGKNRIDKFVQKRRDGSEYTSEVNITSFISPEDKQLYCIVSRDITERIEMQKSLQLMSKAINSSSNEIYIADKDSHIIYCNETVLKNTGYTQEDMESVRAWTMSQSETMRNLEDYRKLYNSLQPGQNLTRRSKQRRKDGSLISVEVDIIAFNSHDGEKLLAAIVTDVSEREAYEERLLEAKQAAESANKAKSTFIANMSHEIRTPLNAIIGFSQILALEIEKESHKSYVESINTAGQALLSLVNDILDISKIEAEKISMISKETDVLKLLEEISMIFKYKVMQKNLSFSLDAGNIPVLMLDNKRLNQVLINLAGNAVKFTDEGTIEMGADFQYNYGDNTSGTLTIWVKDSGIGISEENQKRIFEEFEQVELSDSRSYEGTGLGLSISKKLIKQMGGEIFLESALGAGSCFTIVLPNQKTVDKPDVIIDQHQEDVFLTARGVRAMVVDDIQDNRYMLEEYLQKIGFETLSVQGAEEGLSKLEGFKPDIIISDLRMPVIDGSSFAKQIRQNETFCDIPIIALTAAMESSISYDLTSFDETLLKPVNFSELCDVLSRYFDFESSNFEAYEDEYKKVSPENAGDIWESTIKNLKKMIHSGLVINEVSLAADKLISFGEEKDEEGLIELGKKLKMAVETFDVVQIEKLINKLEDICSIENEEV